VPPSPPAAPPPTPGQAVLQPLGRVAALQEARGASWSNIARCAAAAVQTREKIAALLVEGKLVPPDTAFVVFGSLARLEWTTGSDLDWTLLIDGPADEQHVRVTHEIGATLARDFKKPGPTGVFGNVAFSSELVHRIGGDHDSNRNTSQRILLLLESQSLGAGIEVRDRVVKAIFKRYLVDDYGHPSAQNWMTRVPRFLLNDVVRYWRTMAVDFAAKQRERAGEGWAVRNFKLRMSRKLIFAAGLCTCLSFHLSPPNAGKGSEDLLSTLTEHLVDASHTPPLDVLAGTVSQFSADAAAGDIFGAYDEFLGILMDPASRERLEGLTALSAQGNELFERSRGIGKRFQDGLTALFFETDERLTKATQRYGVF
jgi:hypothetical protein